MVLRKRLADGVVAPLKLASGCDRRCAFCAIPMFRGSFVSRTPDEIAAEALWLGREGVREIVLVSENSTSYGKDLGDLRALEALLPQVASAPGIVRVRVAYLQPAETRPGLLEAIASTPGVADYFDLSFQHASSTVLRRMRRFGGTESFLDLIERIRVLSPEAGLRSNVIVGFPGETEADVDELETFLTQARLDAVGVFGYSDEDGTEAAGMSGKLPTDEVRARVERISALVDELMDQRAEERVGTTVEVLVERVEEMPGGGIVAEGRAEHQGPESDGEVVVEGLRAVEVGDMVRAVVTGHSGPDLVAVPAP
jgi:MiaB/RimO family radical SAM methylthiotransferase